MKTIEEFKQYIAADVLPCPDPVIERAILNTLIEFCEKTHVLTREFTVTLTSETVDSNLQNSIDIDLGDYFDGHVAPVIVMEFNLDGTPKYPKRKQLLNTVPSTVWTKIKEGSTIYFDFPDDSTIRLFDRSTTTETYLYVKMVVKPKRIATQVDDALFDDWLDEIAAGVKYRLLSMPNKEWSDARGAQQNYLAWKRGISKARLKVRKSFTDDPLEVHPRKFADVDYDISGTYYWDV